MSEETPRPIMLYVECGMFVGKEMVFCKDCKYWRNHGKEYPTYCVRPDLLDLYADDYGVEMAADDFCSRGERK